MYAWYRYMSVLCVFIDTCLATTRSIAYHAYIYIYIYIEREIERERDRHTHSCIRAVVQLCIHPYITKVTDSTNITYITCITYVIYITYCTSVHNTCVAYITRIAYVAYITHIACIAYTTRVQTGEATAAGKRGRSRRGETESRAGAPSGGCRGARGGRSSSPGSA